MPEPSTKHSKESKSDQRKGLPPAPGPPAASTQEARTLSAQAYKGFLPYLSPSMYCTGQECLCKHQISVQSNVKTSIKTPLNAHRRQGWASQMGLIFSLVSAAGQRPSFSHVLLRCGFVRVYHSGDLSHLLSLSLQ